MKSAKWSTSLSNWWKWATKSKAGNAAWQRPVVLPLVVLVALVGVYTISRSSAAGAPDLVITAISKTPANPTAGQAVTFSATVKNQGTDVTPAGTIIGVNFKIDGQTVSFSDNYTQSLAPNASVTLTANSGSLGSPTWSATSGPHTLLAFVDEANRFSNELDEANNTLTQGLTIGSTGQVYLSPTTSNVLINNNVAVDVRINPGTLVEGVEATITYDINKLQFISISATGSPFDTALGPQTGGSGTVKITQGTLGGSVGTDAFVAKITFKALVGSGNSTLQVTGNAAHAGVYTNPAGGSATVNFATPDTTPPTVSISSPAANATVFTTTNVNATATDAVGVTKVEFYVDGQLKATDTTSPYSFAFDTSVVSNGAHTLQAKGYDAAGNIGNSALVSVNVRNINEDINQDGQVDLLDFSLLASKFGQSGSGLGRSDINRDGTVNLLDFSLLAASFGT